MGLLDTVIGAAGAMMGGQQQQPQQQGGLAGMLGGLGGAGGLAALLPIVAGMLGNDSQHGGLGGLMEKFNQAGMGDVAKSWVGTGENAPISGDQLGQVLGGDMIGDIASKLGVSHGDAAGGLAQMLPGLIDKLTPHGQAPAGGLGNSGDLMGMLGGLLGQK
jgi:uncharacterized protein YidB (DUF937 family)